MTFLPIVARELRVASRRRSTYWLRSGAALAMIVVGAWFFLMMQQDPSPTIASVLFGVLTGAAVLYCLLSGVRSTADCLSEEKRQGTLGLLFLTDLKGYDVVLGKLAATSLSGFYGVLAVVPMLAVPLLMGGVSPGEFGRMAIVAINTLFFSLSIGICVSAMSRSARVAVGTTFLVILFFSALLPAAGAIVAAVTKARAVSWLFLVPSAGFNFFMALDTPYKGGPRMFWLSTCVISVVGCIFLGLAALIAPRSWQDKPASLQRLRWRERWKLWSYGNSSERQVFRSKLLNANAFFWLSARARLKPALVWAVLGLLACGWTWGLVKFGRDWLNEGLYISICIILNLLLKGWFASEAGRQLAEERAVGSLELLLATPLSVRDILRGQRLALQRQFLGPLLTVLLIDFMLMIATTREAGMPAERSYLMSFWVSAMLMLVADLTALYWVGMWQGLISKNPRRAARSSVARVLVLPWIAFALISLIVSLSRIRTGQGPSEYFFLGLWIVLGLAADIGFAGWARYKLLSDFRVAAGQRYSHHIRPWNAPGALRSAGSTQPATAAN